MLKGGDLKKWHAALKQWNIGKKWSIPRKGTVGYDEVVAIMRGGVPAAAAPAAAAPAAAPKSILKKTSQPEAKKFETVLREDRRDVKAVHNQYKKLVKLYSDIDFPDLKEEARAELSAKLWALLAFSMDIDFFAGKKEYDGYMKEMELLAEFIENMTTDKEVRSISDIMDEIIEENDAKRNYFLEKYVPAEKRILVKRKDFKAEEAEEPLRRKRKIAPKEDPIVITRRKAVEEPIIITRRKQVEEPMVITRRKAAPTEIAELSERVKTIEKAVFEQQKKDKSYRLPKADAAALKVLKKELRELRAKRS